MKICVLIPSSDNKNQAGVRIRYKRVAEVAENEGVEFEIKAIGDFTNRKHFEHDVYIISKCYDAKSILVANYIRSIGKKVGVDVFDDYFSQTDDARFQRLRAWFAQIVESTDFILCSTVSIKQVCIAYDNSKPIHVLNDPYDVDELVYRADHNIYSQKTYKNDDQLKILWFGMGDNPNFKLGIDDLYGYLDFIMPLVKHNPKVIVLTNRRALTYKSLLKLSQIPFETEIQEWSPEKESQLLRSSHLALLPVNHQGFSRVKSMNRAITALTCGCQVLSLGYELYSDLHDFIYRDVDTFLQDYSKGSMRNNAFNTDFEVWLEQNASPDKESKDLLLFLSNELPKASIEEASSLVALIHGMVSPSDIHKFTQRLKMLSVSSPLNESSLNYDVRFIIDGMSLTMLVNKKLKEFMNPQVQDRLVDYGKVLDKEFWKIDHVYFEEHGIKNIQFDYKNASIFVKLSGYVDLLSQIKTMLVMVFDEVKVVLSEQSYLPYSCGFNTND